jgi:tRNA 2-thiouridine synthesizing protein E
MNYEGRRVDLNEEGFLLHPEEWNEKLAVVMAREAEGLEELSEDHWAIIRFIREHYLANQSAPMLRAMCKGTGVPLKRVYELFPSGPAKGACKLAGLPKPDGCV